jgi:hypothetical protein
MTDIAKTKIGQYNVASEYITTSTSDVGERKRSKGYEPIDTAHGPSSSIVLQPSVADVSEDNTPTPTTSHEPSQTSFEPAGSSRPASQPSQPSHKQSPPIQQNETLPQPTPHPPQVWYSDPTSQTWHSTASPPQSPVIHQYGFQVPGQVQYPYDFSYGYAPRMATGGYQPYTSPYYPQPFSPVSEASQPPAVERHVSRSGSGEENNDLMTRIQNVLPDLSRLLEQYKEGQTLPTAAENTISGLSSQENEKLTTLQQELNATKKEYERVIRNLVDENCTLKNEAKDRQRRCRSLEGDSRSSRKLKSEYEALQAQHQNLANSVDSIRLSKEELMAEKLKHIESLKKDKHIIKESHQRVLADLKAQHMETLAAKDNEHQKAIAEQKSFVNKIQLDLATLISKHTTTKRELENKHHSEAAYKAQCDRLKTNHQRALESLKQEHKSQRLRHEEDTKKHFMELEAFRNKEIGWERESRALQAELQEHKVALASERDAHASLKAIHEERNKRTADLSEAMTSWRKKHAELQRESENLDGVLLGLGFGSNAAEGIPGPQATDPTTILNEPTCSVEEPAVAIGDAEAVAQEGATDRAEKAIAPVQESRQEPSKVAETIPAKEPVTSTELPRETEPTIAREEVTTMQIVAKPLPSEVKEGPKEATTIPQTETTAKEGFKYTQSKVQAAEDPVIFRPILYYQIPGQYQY